jgi:hypothetical protein
VRSKKAQTHLKRAREQAVKERRDRKQAKRQAKALERRSQATPTETSTSSDPEASRVLDAADAAALDRRAWNTP